ncbi:unnamed protein product [Mytilus coruscus]|uniref:Uncharacterized protein n=1 Tax=Mytilus coruscus TaxID=42192 RepID=A0A6J8EEX1_MYTCO|nr:unnamed protein product [Mytilus coruscus]
MLLNAVYKKFFELRFQGVITITWGKWLLENIGIHPSYARRLRECAKSLGGYFKLYEVGLSFTEIYKLKKELVALFNSSPEMNTFWKQNPDICPTQEMESSQEVMTLPTLLSKTKCKKFIQYGECEFDQQKYPEVDPHLKPIDKRDAFYGGRTETIQLYNNLSDLKDTFMKYKQEASGCKCDPKYCKNDCKNDKECKTKIQYIIDNTAYDLDIDKVKYNSGLRFIAKICLNNLWGHFGMRDNFTQKEYCFTLEHITKIVFNEKYKDISTMILDENIVLTEYKEKEEYSKPNPSVNVYIALFTTAHARLKLYELLDILQERVLYMDTDSCIYNDDGSEACKKVENMMGSKLGDLTDEIVSKHNANHIKQFISAGPKDYSMKLDTEKLVSCCKGFRLNAEVEKKITLDKKKKIVTDENEKYETVKYNNIKIGKDHQLKTVKQVKSL